MRNVFGGRDGRWLAAIAAVIVMAVIALSPVESAKAGPATHLKFMGVDTAVTVNTTTTFQVEALDANGNRDTGFTGQVSFAADCTKSGGQVVQNCFTALSPVDQGTSNGYTFKTADQGRQTFTMKWTEVATVDFGVGDPSGNHMWASDEVDGIQVTSADPVHWQLSKLGCCDDTVGTSQTWSVQAQNAQGEAAKYSGPVTFSATCGNCFTVDPNMGGSNSKSTQFDQSGVLSFVQVTVKWTDAGTWIFSVKPGLSDANTAAQGSSQQVTITDPNATTTTTSTSTTSTTVKPTTTTTVAGGGTTTTTVAGGGTSTTTSTTVKPTTTTTLAGGGTTTTTAPSNGTTTTVAGSTTPTTSGVPCNTPVVQLSAGSLQRGQRGTVTGSCFAPNSSVRIELHSSPVVLGSTTTNAAGSFSFTFTVPSSTSLGSHSIVAVGVNGQSVGVSPSAGFTVVSGLPRTGSNSDRAALFGLALLSAGFGLVVAAKKRLAPRGAHFQ